MSTASRLTEVFNSAERVFFNNTSKIVFISDCHRGDNSWADGFAGNQNLFFTALNYYYDENYIYMELGDGDELWENSKFSDIRDAHSDAFWIMKKFHDENRLYMLYGNHDIMKKYPGFLRDNMYRYYDEHEKVYKPLLEGLKVHEGLILKHEETGRNIFLVHGHQGDPLSDSLWRLGRFLVRNLWRNAELLGVKDPTSAAKNHTKKSVMEEGISDWSKQNNQMVIAGHTHRPRLPKPGEILYFNDGSCVHPRCITCIEIGNGEICLVKWSVLSRTDGTLYAAREILEGPQKLSAYLGGEMRVMYAR